MATISVLDKDSLPVSVELPPAATVAAAIQTAVETVAGTVTTNRLAVNLISGQAGITAGAGAVAATTPRVTHASDDPVTVSLQLLDNAISGSGFNITQMNGVNVSMGSGAVGTGTQRITLGSDDPGVVSLALIDDTIFADNGTFTIGTNKTVVLAGVYQSSPATKTDGKAAAILTDANGRIQVAAGSAEDTTLGAVRTMGVGSEYETVAASQNDQNLGATGATGDFLSHLLCVVTTPATSQVQIKDGSGGAITVLPNGVGPGIGIYPIPWGGISLSGAWKVTTAAGVSVVAFGAFT